MAYQKHDEPSECVIAAVLFLVGLIPSLISLPPFYLPNRLINGGQEMIGVMGERDVCVNLTSSAPSLSPPADYRVPEAVSWST